uniref:Uncharacterized protein n=1 Tax=Chromera velia CCMP2878 TaxID=1169474 RepID=A0A0G4G1X3_9ALVE|eukprot:Cvel_19838.t1-p1 / transcript=Cvel_19838.t1 / gene=Cvel_19838 / organism=Chromera_velia_CCMP2878 / gene_product=hypothetical protein / transcript_product=hypothetical protein / location=Cvel_scaffold1736:23780-25096(+) / protein_length=439 / sequence_SO=supercontig / SO=protein_coding / is_pseudo=false
MTYKLLILFLLGASVGSLSEAAAANSTESHVAETVEKDAKAVGTALGSEFKKLTNGTGHFFEALFQGSNKDKPATAGSNRLLSDSSSEPAKNGTEAAGKAAAPSSDTSGDGDGKQNSTATASDPKRGEAAAAGKAAGAAAQAEGKAIAAKYEKEFANGTNWQKYASAGADWQKYASAGADWQKYVPGFRRLLSEKKSGDGDSKPSDAAKSTGADWQKYASAGENAGAEWQKFASGFGRLLSAEASGDGDAKSDDAAKAGKDAAAEADGQEVAEKFKKFANGSDWQKFAQSDEWKKFANGTDWQKFASGASDEWNKFSDAAGGFFQSLFSSGGGQSSDPKRRLQKEEEKGDQNEEGERRLNTQVVVGGVGCNQYVAACREKSTAYSNYQRLCFGSASGSVGKGPGGNLRASGSASAACVSAEKNYKQVEATCAAIPVGCH